MKAPLYPSANRTARYWPNGGGILQSSLDKLVLHSTETTGLPSYSNGGTAPDLTIDPWGETLKVWQHFRSVAMSAKALRDTGGFAENRDHVAQVEIIGYSDPRQVSSGKYLPTAPDEVLRRIAEVTAWFHVEWGIPLAKPTQPWPYYPNSYGKNNGARMSTAQFDAYSGILGHLHVPDSVHGDPSLDIDKVLAFARELLNTPQEPTLPILHPGASGDGVLALRNLLIMHGYTVLPYGAYDTATYIVVRSFQRRMKLTVDGLVGASTWGALKGPVKPRKTMPILREGSRGSNVEELQKALSSILGIDVNADGIFGKATGDAVESLQRKAGFTKENIDRVVGPNTWRVLSYKGV